MHPISVTQCHVLLTTKIPETFLLFSQDIPSQNLGFVDARAAEISVTVAGRDYTLHQSPTILLVLLPGVFLVNIATNCDANDRFIQYFKSRRRYHWRR